MNVSWQKFGQWTLALGVAGAFMATAIPEADASRRASLAENRLVEDRNDVYLFPQLVVDYSNLIVFDYGAAEGAGSGLFLFGDDAMAFGIGVYRGDVTEPNLFPYQLGHTNLGSIGNPLPGFEQPHTVLDLFGGFDLGGSLAGGRLTFANGSDRFVNLDNEVTSESQTFIGATLGFSLVDDLRLDTGLRLQFATGNITVADDTAVTGSSFLVGVTARGFTPMTADMDLGFLADIYFQSSSATVIGDDELDIPDFTQGDSTFALAVGAGPSFDINEVATIAGYGVLGIARATIDPDVDETDDRTFLTQTVLPGVHIAGDFQIREWLYFRSGMQYNFSTNSQTQEFDPEDFPDADRDTTVASFRDSGFAWRAGIGVESGGFFLDGTFQQGFILNGPDFLGGAGGGLFSMVSAGYSW